MTVERYETLRLREEAGVVTLTIQRPEARNSVNQRLLAELDAVLGRLEAKPRNAVVVLEGQPGVFCTGMDFAEMSALSNDALRVGGEGPSSAYMRTLRRMSSLPHVVIAKVDGEVLAGGVGLVAASDLVIATPRSRFSLTEALWGLLPAMVLPYLIRRIGFQQAYRMTLTSQALSAEAALKSQLVDEVSDDPDAAIHRARARLARVSTRTVADIKRYFRAMWLVSDEMEALAVSEITRLMALPDVRANIRNFVEHQTLPWETQD